MPKIKRFVLFMLPFFFVMCSLGPFHMILFNILPNTDSYNGYSIYGSIGIILPDVIYFLNESFLRPYTLTATLLAALFFVGGKAKLGRGFQIGAFALAAVSALFISIMLLVRSPSYYVKVGYIYYLSDKNQRYISENYAVFYALTILLVSVLAVVIGNFPHLNPNKRCLFSMLFCAFLLLLSFLLAATADYKGFWENRMDDFEQFKKTLPPIVFSRALTHSVFYFLPPLLIPLKEFGPAMMEKAESTEPGEKTTAMPAEATAAVLVEMTSESDSIINPNQGNTTLADGVTQTLQASNENHKEEDEAEWQ